MKNAVILFKNSRMRPDVKYLGEICDGLCDCGVVPQIVEILSETDDVAFKKRVEELVNTVDNLFVFADENLAVDVKGIIAEVTSLSLVENDNAREIVKNQDIGGAAAEDCAFIPENATLIPNFKGIYQGFMLEDGEFTLFLLPSEREQCKAVISGYLSPYFEKARTGAEREYIVKYYGDAKKAEEILERKQAETPSGFYYGVYCDNCDCTVRITFSEKKYEKKIKEIREELGDAVYADKDITLSETLFKLLKARKMKISTAESFTAGRIAADIIKNPGASEHFTEGVVPYCEEAKEYRLDVPAHDIRKHGVVSARVAYRMAAGLLKKKNCDIALSTTGYAGPTGGDDLPAGLCYMAVGNKDGVHVYKFKFKGDRETVTETAKNSALYLAIQELKK